MMISVEAMKSAVVSKPGRARSDRKACHCGGHGNDRDPRGDPAHVLKGRALARFFQRPMLWASCSGSARALHITAVLTALVWMFVPAANAYFREKGAYFRAKSAGRLRSYALNRGSLALLETCMTRQITPQ
jgi:hypothetical protein